MFRQAPSFPYHDLGIVEDGNTASRAISKDSYVIWKGESYFASTDILQGATLEENVNLTAIPDGVINGVVDAVNNKTTTDEISHCTVIKRGNVVSIISDGGGSYSISGWGTKSLGTLPEAFRPSTKVSQTYYGRNTSNGSGAQLVVEVETSGGVKIRNFHSSGSIVSNENCFTVTYCV